MNKKKFLYIITAAAMVFALAGCGPSAEMLYEAETARELLLQKKEAVEEIYLDITDESEKKTLEDLSQKVSEIQDIDLKKLNDNKIDEILPSITEMTEKYTQLESELSGILTTETGEREERAKHESIDVYIVNKTGMNLSRIVLHDLTNDTFSDNYLGDGITLMAGYTLMGVSLDIYQSGSEWEFVITDENDTSYNLPSDDLKKSGLSGAALVLSYDTKTKEGKAELGSALANTDEMTEELPQPEENSGEEEKAE